MIGNDVEALQAVLSADQWREHLLAEEKRLNALCMEMEKGIQEGDTRSKEKFDDDREKAASDLKEVYGKLEAIESDKAEARYAYNRSIHGTQLVDTGISLYSCIQLFAFFFLRLIVPLLFCQVLVSLPTDIATLQRASLEVGECVWRLLALFSTSPICCFWTSLQTCWIFLLLSGSRTT